MSLVHSSLCIKQNVKTTSRDIWELIFRSKYQIAELISKPYLNVSTIYLTSAFWQTGTHPFSSKAIGFLLNQTQRMNKCGNAILRQFYQSNIIIQTLVFLTQKVSEYDQEMPQSQTAVDWYKASS